ncbi:MAG: LysM peptidoglycan-binding domain-containing protein [Bdellovibrio sp.]|nr:LysM peptidoglycan-binding domain-containing protein [Bdellovibrio sp.]
MFLCFEKKIIIFLAFCYFLVSVLVSEASVTSQKYYYHIVNVEARNLSAIALFMYGKSSMYKKIAQWNQLQPPFKIKLGQKLKLELQPLLTKEEGEKKILSYWRKKFDLNFDHQFAHQNDVRAIALKTVELKKVEIKQKFDEALKVKPVDIEFETPDSKKLFLDGKKLFDEKKLPEALSLFRKSREIEKEYLPPWIFEIKTLGELGNLEEQKQVVTMFVKTHPNLKNLPFIKQVENRAPAKEH